MTELKKCPIPWCNGVGELATDLGHSQVQCSKCRIYTSIMPEPERAVSSWNARPELDRLEALNTELVEALEEMASYANESKRNNTDEFLEGLFENVEISAKLLAKAKGAEDEK